MNNPTIDIFKDALHHILSLSRFSKRAIVLLIDISLCVLTVWLAFYLRLGEFTSLYGDNFWAVAISVILLLPVFFFFNLYRVIFRYSDWQSMYVILIAILVYGLLYASIITFIGISTIPRTIGLIQPLLLFFLVLIFRVLGGLLLESIFLRHYRKTSTAKALVYGAGSAGRQLVSALERTKDMQVVGFLDDDSQFHRQISFFTQ